jgi:hypothetical protein
MITRAEYMAGNRGTEADMRANFRAYYGDVIAAMGGPKRIDLPFTVEEVRAALAAGDFHLNTLPLPQWDNYARSLPGAAAALKTRGDWLSLGTGVCILKEAARLLAEEPV